jgi:methionine sulfoxide reductase heme-binding subunit
MPGWISSASTDPPADPRGARRHAPARTPGWQRALKAAVFLAALLPLARLVAAGTAGAFGGLGANPVEFVTRSTGTWTLVFLCITLSVTPLRRISGWRWPQRLRRMLGLFAFFYGALHFTTYLWFEQWFEVRAIVIDVIERPFITAGFIAFVLMVPLAVTSTDAMVRRLGRQWSQLHRLAYVIAPVGVLHFWWHKAGKNDLAEPAIYAAIVIALLGWRLFDHLRRR